MPTQSLVLESPARITLSLDIVRKIPSGPLCGYHELGVVKHKINLFDTIRFSRANRFSLHCDNPEIPTDERNVCTRVVSLMRHRFCVSDNVSVDIKKRIPAEGGLAGGSSNVATTINALNVLWGLNLSVQEKMSLGREIGRDVPFFFIERGFAFDTETTRDPEEISSRMSLWIVLVFPDFGVSTREAYGMIDYARIHTRARDTVVLREKIQRGERDWIRYAHNDFEYCVFSANPQLKRIRQDMLDAGSLVALMTGSGSTLFGIVENKCQAVRVARALPYRTHIATSYESF